MKKRFILILILAVVISQPSFSQKKPLKLNDIVGESYKFYPKTYSQIDWLPNGDKYWYIDKNTLFFNNYFTNKKKEILSLKKLNSEIKDSLKKFPHITWINTEEFFFLNKKNSLIKYNIRTNKDTVLYTISENTESIETNEKSLLSTYQKDNQLYIIKKNGSISQIGGVKKIYQPNMKNYIDDDVKIEKDVIYGKPVHRFEFGIKKGVFWSNDGKKIAFYRNDQSQVSDYPLPSFKNIPAKNNIIKYPMAGGKNEKVTVGIYDVEKYNLVYIEQQWKKSEYLTNISWSTNDDFLYIIELNRDQNHLQLNKFNAVSGNFIKTVVEQIHDKYVHPDQPLIFLPNGNYIYIHEKENYRNFDIYNANDEYQFTANLDNLILEHIVYSDNNKIIFQGIEKNNINQNIYALDITKKGEKPIQINSTDGIHNAKVNGNGKYILDSYSNFNTQYKIDIVEVKNKNNKTILKPENLLEEYQLAKTNLIKLKANDGTILFSRMIKPFDFDKNKKYPIIVYVYNGPNVQLIKNQYLYSASLWMHYIANKGYIVFTIEGRGSANRGVKFEQVTFRELGKVEMEDQLTGVEYLKSLPYVNSDKMAVYGWSFGGFMTLSLMTKYPDVFKVGVAGGPVTDWQLYEIMYTERYMDTPETNPEGFESTSIVKNIGNIKGKILIIHGTDDDVVVPQHSINLLKASVDQGVQIDFFMYPGHKHNVRGKDRTHLMKKILQYIEEHL